MIHAIRSLCQITGNSSNILLLSLSHFVTNLISHLGSGGCSDVGTNWIRTGDPGITGLVSYPLDHEVLVPA